MGDVKAIRIALPPHNEQAEIVAYVIDNKRRIEHIIENVKSSIEKLAEYRTALITSAITGKIEI